MRSKRDALVRAGTAALALCAVLLLLLIAAFILRESLPALRAAGLGGLLGGGVWRPLGETPSYGLRNMLLSTLYTALLAVALAAAVGVGCALFLTVAVPPRLRERLLSVTALLAGVPSVVYGFVGFAVVVRLLERAGMAAGECVLAGAVVLSVMLLPYVISSCCRTMTGVLESCGRPSAALGVSRWYLAARLILPRSAGGVLVSVVLATGRAMGETMAVMMVMGNAISPPGLLKKGETLSALIALEMGAAEVGSPHFSALYFAGLVLLVLLLLINAVFFLLERRLRKGG